jgi:hypothetical protein
MDISTKSGGGGTQGGSSDKAADVGSTSAATSAALHPAAGKVEVLGLGVDGSTMQVPKEVIELWFPSSSSSDDAFTGGNADADGDPRVDAREEKEREAYLAALNRHLNRIARRSEADWRALEERRNENSVHERRKAKAAGAMAVSVEEIAGELSDEEDVSFTFGMTQGLAGISLKANDQVVTRKEGNVREENEDDMWDEIARRDDSAQKEAAAMFAFNEQGELVRVVEEDHKPLMLGGAEEDEEDDDDIAEAVKAQGYVELKYGSILHEGEGSKEKPSADEAELSDFEEQTSDLQSVEGSGWVQTWDSEEGEDETPS